MHRTYEGTNAPVRVYWYSDRVEIQNPGGLYGQVTQENIGTGVTDYRNPLIAEMMHHLGFAQRFGVGLPISLMPLAQEARKPMFFLKPADGAIGSHMAPVQACYMDFSHLAKRIGKQCGVTLS